MPYMEDIATGLPRDRYQLVIAGRPRPGASEKYVLVEEPDEPVLMHWNGHTHLPHFKRDCPNCKDSKERYKPLWYIGAVLFGSPDPLILELTQKCYRTAAAGACMAEADDSSGVVTVFRGLLVEISRGNYERSQRVLRCVARVEVKNDWPYRTREELAKIWGIPLKPKIYKGGEAG